MVRDNGLYFAGRPDKLKEAVQAFADFRQQQFELAVASGGGEEEPEELKGVTDDTTDATNSYLMALAQDFRCGNYKRIGDHSGAEACYCAKLR